MYKLSINLKTAKTRDIIFTMLCQDSDIMIMLTPVDSVNLYVFSDNLLRLLEISMMLAKHKYRFNVRRLRSEGGKYVCTSGKN